MLSLVNKNTTVTVPWADTKEDFVLGVVDGEWIITKDNELYPTSPYDDTEYKIKDSISIYPGLIGSTFWLRAFCEEHHPEIDFDTEFKTDEPGVFARYQEKFGHDYEEWVHNQVYNRVKEEIEAAGYKLPWG